MSHEQLNRRYLRSYLLCFTDKATEQKFQMHQKTLKFSPEVLLLFGTVCGLGTYYSGNSDLSAVFAYICIALLSVFDVSYEGFLVRLVTVWASLHHSDEYQAVPFMFSCKWQRRDLCDSDLVSAVD